MHNDDLLLTLRDCMKAAFPQVLVKLVQEAIKEEPDFKSIARVIAMDPALTTTILSLANSPYYGLSTEVVELERAAVVLGNRELLKLALSVSFQGRVNQQLGKCGIDVRESWGLIIWSATAAQLLAARICPGEQNQVYISALLKDLSLLLLCSTAPEKLPVYKGDAPLLCLHPGQLEAERKAWGVDHAELSSELLKEWGCPVSQCREILHHHDMAGVEKHDMSTRAVILATRWSEVEYHARKNPGLLIQFRTQLSKLLDLSPEEVDRIRSECIEQYKLFSKALEPEKSGQDSFQFEVPLDDLQEAYVMSLDFQHVQGGIPGITETMSRHLRWTFDLREWELGIRKPGSARWIFSRIENGQVATTRELESLHDIPWSEGGVEFKLLAGGNLFGELRIPRSGITPLVEKKINLYVRLASFGLQHYFQNLAVVEGKAKTLELLPLAVAIMDDAGFIQDANAEMHRFLQQEESLVGERFWPLLVKSRGAQMDANWKTFLKDKKIPFYNRVIFALAPVESAHQPSFYLTVHRRVEGGMQVMVEDISGVSHLEVEAIRQREYLQNLLSSMQDLVLTLERDGTISFASSRSEQLVGRNFFTIAKPMGIFINVWGPSVLDSHEGPLQVSIQVGDSEAKPMEMMISKLQSVAGSYMAVGRDLSIILRLEEKIKRQAIYDHLTNIFNRHQFQLFLNKEIDRCHREGRKLGLIFFDVDGLKVLNDKQGHAAGDAMLKELGRILREGFRKGLDFPCRYGGDEFVVLLTGITSGKILHILGERLLEAVHDQFKGTVGLSVGLAILKDKETAEDLINRVDRATYQAKVQGGNRISWAE